METAVNAGHLNQASRHWLRHTHATHAFEAGAEIEEVQKNLGHCSVAITAIYTHASRKSAVEKLIAFAELSLPSLLTPFKTPRLRGVCFTGR